MVILRGIIFSCIVLWIYYYLLFYHQETVLGFKNTLNRACQLFLKEVRNYENKWGTFHPQETEKRHWIMSYKGVRSHNPFFSWFTSFTFLFNDSFRSVLEVSTFIFGCCFEAIWWSVLYRKNTIKYMRHSQWKKNECEIQLLSVLAADLNSGHEHWYIC